MRGGRPLQSRVRNSLVAGPHDGRQRGAGQVRAVESRNRSRCSKSATQRKPATPFSIPLKGISLNVRAARDRHRGAAGNGQGEFFDPSPARLQQDAASVRIAAKDAVASPSPTPAALPSCRKSARPWCRRVKLSRTLLSRHATTARRFGTGGWSGGAITPPPNASSGDGRAQERAGPEAAAFGRQSAEIHRRRELDRRPSVIVVNQPTWGAGGAAARRQA